MELGTGMLAGSRKRKRTASPLPQMHLTICRGIDDFKVLRPSDDLHLAAEEGQLRSCKKLVGSGKDVNSRNHYERQTPLHKAVANGHSRVVSYLLKVGADPFALDREHRSPIGLAFDNMKNEVILRLMLDVTAVQVPEQIVCNALVLGLSTRTLLCLYDKRISYSLGPTTARLAQCRGLKAASTLVPPNEVPTLKDLCRFVIRKALGPSLDEKLHALPLTPSLLLFVNFGEPYLVPAMHKTSPRRRSSSNSSNHEVEEEAQPVESEWVLVTPAMQGFR